MFEKFKVWLLAVFTPLIFALGYIWVLLNKRQKLEDELSQSRTEKQLGDSLSKLADQKRTADDSEEKFDNALDSFDSALSDYQKSKRDV